MPQSNQGGSNRGSGPAGNSTRSDRHSGNSNKRKSTQGITSGQGQKGKDDMGKGKTGNQTKDSNSGRHSDTGDDD